MLICKEMGWTFTEYDDTDWQELEDAIALYGGYTRGEEKRSNSRA